MLDTAGAVCAKALGQRGVLMCGKSRACRREWTRSSVRPGRVSGFLSEGEFVIQEGLEERRV